MVMKIGIASLDKVIILKAIMNWVRPILGFRARSEYYLAGCVCLCLGTFISLGAMGTAPIAGRLYAAGGPRKATEYEIKAVYLYNFLLFVEWPESDDDEKGDSGGTGKIEGDRPIVIGIVGDDPFGESFKEVEGKPVLARKRRLEVKRFGRYWKKTDLSGCDLLFVCESEKKNFSEILGPLNGKPVLTVGEWSGFLDAGGMINLVKVKNKIRWEINRTPVKKARLKMSAQLLRNATRVVEIPKPEENRPAGKTTERRRSEEGGRK